VRASSVRDCAELLASFGIDPANGESIDVGGTESVYLDDSFQPNPLRTLSPQLTLLDRGFNVEVLGTTTDHEVDLLDPEVAKRLDSQFDLTYCFDTLEHVSDPFAFCEHLVQITRPGGWIFIATVFSWPYHPSPEDYFRYSPVGLRECFVGRPNRRATEIEILWHGWDHDQRGVALLGRRLSQGERAAPSDPPEHIDDTLARPYVQPPVVLRVRRRIGRALGLEA
jgi:SAM-dependent methyltransferase